MSITVRDVAAAAGVSPGTASRALRGHPQISEECISRVRGIAAVMGYRPLRDRSGRRRSEPLAGRRIAIAMLGIDPTLGGCPTVREAILSVEECLSEAGAHPVLVNVPDPSEPPRSLRRTRFDGIIANATLQGDIVALLGSKLLTVLQSSSLIWVLGRPPGADGDAVNPDNLAVGQIAAEALIAKGHRRLAFINPKADHLMFAVREQGFRLAAAGRKASIAAFTSRCGINGGSPIQPITSVADVQPLVDALLRERPRPTAIFCPADSIAVLTYRALAARGLEPGGEIAVISCDNEQSLITGLLPTLATIDVHPRQIGRLAVRQLTRRITGEFDGSAVTIEVKPTLLPGVSLTSPRSDDDGGTRPAARRRTAGQG